ncbi:MAG: sigma-54-dependent Fis family transcriptional regulator [Planctomycetes bacterium]|nr:sigma-54-dependent Fis family transcriptional regulator [Planctomycetota bacterium]
MTTALAVGRVNQVANRARVHVVASAGNLTAIVENLGRLGHEVFEFPDVATAAQAAQAAAPDLLLIDQAVAKAMTARPEWPTLVVTDEPRHGQDDGGFGVVSRGAGIELLAPLVHLAIEVHQRDLRLAELERLTEGMRDGGALVGRSPAVRRLQGVMRRAADSDATVLIEGPAGAGKSLVARILHCKSRRGHRALVVVDGGSADADGMAAAIEQARGSTLVIEDIGQLPQPAQALVVRHLKERPPSGSPDQIARVIATTSAHLPEMVARGAFREDLYYRLHALPIVVPSLRERPEDVGVIASAILDSCAPRGGQRPAGFTATALILLESLPWPGNVAQLENVIRRAHALAGGGPIDRVHLLGPSTGLDADGEPRARRAAPTQEAADDSGEIGEDAIRPFDEEEQRLLSRALRATKGNVRRAAQLLAIGRATLYRKIQQYKLRLQ